MKYLLSIIAAFMLFTTVPAKADHQDLMVGKTYQDHVIICDKSKMKAFVRGYQADSDRAKDAATNNECTFTMKVFTIDNYICSFKIDPRTFSVIKAAEEYMIIFASTTRGQVLCTDEQLDALATIE